MAFDLQNQDDPAKPPSNLRINKIKSAPNQGMSLAYATQEKTAKKNVMDNKSNDNTSKKKLCLCAPTTHAGSFRCRFHRTIANQKRPLVSPWLNFGKSRQSFNSVKVIAQPQLSRFGRAAAAAVAAK